MSGVSVRTLHFYDETGLLKPAYVGANGYRFYEDPQLLTLQQILFFRELGFELKQIQRLLGRGVAAGKDRFNEHIKLGGPGGEPNDCKVSSKDTDGAMCVFEFTGISGGPPHVHHNQDEWIYVVEGEFEIYVGNERFHLSAGESVFMPRKVKHRWSCLSDKPGKIINVYQPAGTMEEFFRKLGKPPEDLITAEQMAEKTYAEEQVKSLHRLFAVHGMDILPPPGHEQAPPKGV